MRKPRAATYLLALLTVLAMASVSMSPAGASGIVIEGAGLTVSGSLAMYTVAPGQSYTHTMIVSLGSGAAAPMDVQVDARGLRQGPDGSIQAVTAEEDTCPYSALPDISFIRDRSFRLQPGESREITARIDVPADFGDATHYAVIYIHALAGEQAGITMIPAVNVPVVLTPVGADQSSAGEITALDVENGDPGQPLKILTTLLNTGKHHFKASNLVSVTDAAGAVVWSGPAPVTDMSIVPGFSRQFVVGPASGNSTAGLAPGTYAVKSQVVLETGEIVASRDTTFSVEPSGDKPPKSQPEDVVPPPTASSDGCPWDVNQDGIVDAADVTHVNERWAETGDPGWIREDVNRDGVVNTLDLVAVGNHFGTVCP